MTTFRGENKDQVQQFKQRANLPLVKCWRCDCSVRVVNHNGLCELCQPGMSGKSENHESDGLKTEINTDDISL